MSDNPDHPLTKYAIEDGAFLFLKKPIGMDVIRNLWQHVLREKTRKMKERENFEEVVKNNNIFRDNLGYKEASRKGIRIEEATGYDSGNAMRGKSKLCTDWTQELHEKFMDAVQILGEGSKNILYNFLSIYIIMEMFKK